MSKKPKNTPQAPMHATDKALVDLATLILNHATDGLAVQDAATALRVSRIAVYKWLHGHPISPPYAFIIVSKMRHRIPSMRHKKRREQALRLLDLIESEFTVQV